MFNFMLASLFDLFSNLHYFSFCLFPELILFFIIVVFQGRPKGVTPKYSLKPLVPRLSELLGVQVWRLNFVEIFVWDLCLYVMTTLSLTKILSPPPTIGENGQ